VHKVGVVREVFDTRIPVLFLGKKFMKKRKFKFEFFPLHFGVKLNRMDCLLVSLSFVAFHVSDL